VSERGLKAKEKKSFEIASEIVNSIDVGSDTRFEGREK